MGVPPVAIEFTVEGLEEVKKSFGEVSKSSQQTSEEVAEHSKAMAKDFRMVGMEIFVVARTGKLITELGEQMGFLDKATADALGKVLNLTSMLGGVMVAIARLIPLLQTATAAEWMHTIALKAKAIALAITQALSGPVGWVILAGAVAAAAVGIALAMRVPEKQFGGPIYETGLYKLHAGEYVSPTGRSPSISIGPFVFPGLTVRKESDIELIRRAVREELADSVNYLKSRGMI